jgi:hypothetical protein
MIKCEVEQNRMGHLIVTFPGTYPTKDMYIQAEADIEAFVDGCGGDIDNPEDITECDEGYYDFAEIKNG